MSKKKSIIAAILSMVLAVTSTGCDEGGTPADTAGGNTLGDLATSATTTTVDPDENAATDKEAKEIASEEYVPDGNAGTVKYLNHYDLANDHKTDEQYLVFTSEQYGGTFDYVNCAFNDFNDKLAAMIAADDSPDIVVYGWIACPGGIIKNMYEPLDDKIDLDTALWADMKTAVEDFAYKGKHYYYPTRIGNNFALNYSRKTIEDAGLTDPYDLYMSGNWTWDTWRQMMIDFCNQSDENIGFGCSSDVLTAFVATTGVNFVNVNADGTFSNNLGSPDVARAMGFIEDLNRDGLFHQKQLGDWVSPELWAVNSDRMLFIGMEPEWCYEAATAQIQDPRGTENDIYDTVSDFAFVPFPRDPQSEVYHLEYDTFGYMVPKGAKNMKGAIDWIYCNRVFETDENVIAQAKEDHVNPPVVTYVDGKFAGQRKWQIKWDDRAYDMLMEMRDPSKFVFNFDECYGFSDELKNLIANDLLNEVAYNGGSWTQLSEVLSPNVDAVLEQFTR